MSQEDAGALQFARLVFQNSVELNKNVHATHLRRIELLEKDLAYERQKRQETKEKLRKERERHSAYIKQLIEVVNQENDAKKKEIAEMLKNEVVEMFSKNSAN